MNHRSWKVLCWNVRGINLDKKWNSIRDRIMERNYDIACFQETKRSFFDLSFIHQFCPLLLTVLNFFHLLVHLEAPSLCGKVIILVVTLFSRIHMPLQ